MDKIKKAWRENRVMFVLTIVVILCIIIILGVMFKYFMGGSSSSYGDRLDNIANTPVTQEIQDNIKSKFVTDAMDSVSIEIKGKIIYVIAKFKTGISLTEAQSKASESYNALTDDYKKLYDYNVTIVQDANESGGGFCLMGAKNINSGAFVWSNNTPVSSGD